jgi:hypothetical protein
MPCRKTHSLELEINTANDLYARNRLHTSGLREATAAKKMEEMQSGDKDYLMRHQNGAVSLFLLSMGLSEGNTKQTWNWGKVF